MSFIIIFYAFLLMVEICIHKFIKDSSLFFIELLKKWNAIIITISLFYTYVLALFLLKKKAYEI